MFKEMFGLPRLILLNTHKTFKTGKVKGNFWDSTFEYLITALMVVLQNGMVIPAAQRS